MNARHSADADAPLDIIFTSSVFTRAQVSPTEVAAVTAVLTAVIDEKANGRADAPVAPSAWQRSQRSLGTPIVPGLSAWRTFSADDF